MSRALVLAILVLALGACAALAYFFFFDPYASRLWQARFGDLVAGGDIPEELRDARYLLTAQNGGGSYERGVLRYDEYRTDGSLVTDEVSEGSRLAKIIFRPGAGTYDLVVDGTVLHSSPAPKRSLALAPDGSLISFAQLEEIPGKEGASWITNIIALDGTRLSSAPGAAASFLNTSNLFMLREDGAYVVDLSTGSSTRVINRAFLPGYGASVRSADGTRVAWVQTSPETRGVGVYGIEQTAEGWKALEFAALESNVITIALGERELYGVMYAEESVALFKFDYGTEDAKPVVIRKIPAILAPAKIQL